MSMFSNTTMPVEKVVSGMKVNVSRIAQSNPREFSNADVQNFERYWITVGSTVVDGNTVIIVPSEKHFRTVPVNKGTDIDVLIHK